MSKNKVMVIGMAMLLIVQVAGFAQRYSYFHIYDLAHKAYLVSERRALPPGIHHNKVEASKLPQNAEWRFELAETVNGTQYYYIVDRLYGTAIAGGDNYDQDIYRYDNYRGKRNAQWKATEQNLENGQFPFVFTDRKHNRDLVAGALHDGHVYHQDAGEKSNGRWVVELVSKGTQGPDFFVVEQRLIGLELHTNKAAVLSDNPVLTIDGQRVPNNSEVTQRIELKKRKLDSVEESWSFKRAVKASIFQSVSVSGGLTGGVEVKSTTTIGLEIEHEWVESKTHRVDNELTWTIPVEVPPHSVIEVNGVITKLMRDVPFTATIENTLGSGETKEITVDGVWTGVEYVSGEISFNQTK